MASSSFDIHELIGYINKTGTNHNHDFHLWCSKRDALVECWLHELDQGVRKVKHLTV